MSPRGIGSEDVYIRAAPPVLDSEPADFDEDADVAADHGPGGTDDVSEVPADATVFIPTAARPDAGGHAEVQLRRTDHDELALPVYSSIEALVTCCGDEQPWVAFKVEHLADIVMATGATGIAQDVELPADED